MAISSDVRRGTLGRYELVPFVRTLCENRVTGIARLKSEEGAEVRVYIDAGKPRLCVGTGPQHGIGAYLLRSGTMGSEELRGHIRAAKESKRRLEEYLMAEGLLDEDRLQALRQSMSHMVFGDAATWSSAAGRAAPGQLPSIVARFELDIPRAVSEFYLRWYRHDPRAELAAGGCGLPAEADGAYECVLLPDADAMAAQTVWSVFGALGLWVATGLERGLSLEQLQDVSAARCVLAAMTLGLVRWREATEAPQPEPVEEPRKAAPSEPRPDLTATVERVRRKGWLPKAPLGAFPGAIIASHDTSGLAALLEAHGLWVDGLPPLEDTALVAQARGRIDAPATPPPVSSDSGDTEDALSAALAEAVAIAAEQPEDELASVQTLDISDAAGHAVAVPLGETAERRLRMDRLRKTTEQIRRTTSTAEITAAADRARADRSGRRGLVAPPPREREAPAGGAAREIWDMRVKLSESNHFSVLDLEPGAPLSAIRDRYVTLRAHFDPSVLGGNLDPQATDDLALIGRVLDRAVDELTEPARRAAVEAGVDGGMNAFQTKMYFDAERAWREAKKLVESRDYPGAIRRLDRALELNTREPEYAVWRVELEWDRRVADGRWEQDGKDWVRRRLLTVVEKHPAHIQARVLLARLELESGRAAEALDLYRAVLNDQPRHVEAKGAVAELEGQVAASSRGGRGLFGRFRRDS